MRDLESPEIVELLRQTVGRQAEVINELQISLAAAQRERDEAIRANHSVSVCKDHTADITGPGCVICELYSKHAELALLREKQGGSP